MSTTQRCAIWRNSRSKSRSVAQKLRKWPISKSICAASMHVIKRLIANYDTPRQYLIFSMQIFDILSSFVIRTFKARVLQGVDRQSRVGLFFFSVVEINIFYEFFKYRCCLIFCCDFLITHLFFSLQYHSVAVCDRRVMRCCCWWCRKSWNSCRVWRCSTASWRTMTTIEARYLSCWKTCCLSMDLTVKDTLLRPTTMTIKTVSRCLTMWTLMQQAALLFRWLTPYFVWHKLSSRRWFCTVCVYLAWV